VRPILALPSPVEERNDGQPPVSPTQVEMEREIHGAARWREVGIGMARFVRGNLKGMIFVIKVRGSTLDDATSRPSLPLSWWRERCTPVRSRFGSGGLARHRSNALSCS
jgi:hypothetical protein